MPIRILTFNIQNGHPWIEGDPFTSAIDLHGVAHFIYEQGADIICLQEVERGFDGGRQVNPPPNYARLREMLGSYDSVFSYPLQNDTEIPFGLGLAIFSKTPLRDFEKIDLPAADIEFEFQGKMRKASSRLLIEASTTIAGREVRLMNTHLQAFFMIGSSSDAHPEQRNFIEQRLKLHSDHATILAGDMNSAPEESIVQQFADVGFQTAQNAAPTWRRRPYIVDHIFFNSEFVLKSAGVVQSDVSDHLPVVVNLEFR
jgi:endonuclease/exonuclease/phosphatase family metal-dependent hydrolase